LVNRYNADLANLLGNLLNRTVNMTSTYFPAGLKRIARKLEQLVKDPGDLPRFAEVVLTASEMHYPGCFEKSEAGEIPGAIIVPVRELASACNQLIEDAAPWKLSKSDNERDRETLAAVLYAVSESLRIIAILISPVTPRAAHGIFDQLNWKMELSGKEERFSLADAEWGRLPDGHVVGKPVPLFPRIETI